VYGDVGLGKTHLLHAIGNACAHARHRVLYTTSEQFTNALIESIRHKSTAEFRDHYRYVDVLLIDDLQFVAHKESTQEELFHTFNALHSQGKQVVLAADRQPSDIKGLAKRLLSRFEWGLTVDIQPPSLETRLAIIQDKSEMQGYHLSDEVAHLIAQQSSGNVRELEGTLTQVLAYSALMGTPLTLEITERILRNKRGRTQHRDIEAKLRRLSVEQVLEGTARALQMSLEDLTGKRRTKDIVQARQWAIYLAREETQASWPEIGGALGGRNHSTVLSSYNKVAEQIASDPEMRHRLNTIRQQLRDVI
jgi:chromosomal replication initiator protein